MIKLRVFISSVQKELSSERMALRVLMSVDPFLQRATVPKLWEIEAAPLAAKKAPYLDLLRACQIFVLIIGREYGPKGKDKLSPTQKEYRLAQKLKLPTLVCLKNVSKREQETDAMLSEIKRDGHTYSRFTSMEDLQKKVRERLVHHIRNSYHIEPSSEEARFAEDNLGVASIFERQRLSNIGWKDFDRELARNLVAAVEEVSPEGLKEKEIQTVLLERGYLRFDPDSKMAVATAAGAFLLSNDPTKAFPQARLQIDAYAGTEKNARASDYAFLRGPIPHILDEAWAFVRRNTRHPLRVVGLTRVDLDEYPREAFREALVNALAHRDFQEAGRKVMVEIFANRIVVSSPGLPPGKQSLQRIAKGKAQPRARNPLLTQGLAWLKQMDDRGTGIRRMRDAMLDHGLDEPRYALDDGTFVVTLVGPGENMERLRLPAGGTSGISPSVEQRMNSRQKRILEHTVLNGKVTSGWCRREFKVTYDTANRDLLQLVEWRILNRVGRGRSTHFTPRGQQKGGS